MGSAFPIKRLIIFEGHVHSCLLTLLVYNYNPSLHKTILMYNFCAVLLHVEL